LLQVKKTNPIVQARNFAIFKLQQLDNKEAKLKINVHLPNEDVFKAG
jgi:hypothetical protein